MYLDYKESKNLLSLMKQNSMFKDFIFLENKEDED